MKHRCLFVGGSVDGQVSELDDSIFSAGGVIQVPALEPPTVYYGEPDDIVTDIAFTIQLYRWTGHTTARGERVLLTDAPASPRPLGDDNRSLGRYASRGAYARDLLRRPVTA